MHVGMLSLSASPDFVIPAKHSLRRHKYHLANEQNILSPVSYIKWLTKMWYSTFQLLCDQDAT